MKNFLRERGVEDNVLTLPYRIHSDYQFARVDEMTSFTVDVGK